MSERTPIAKRDQLTGRNRNDLATVGHVSDVTDVKVGAILNAYVLPLRERVAALETPWWRRLYKRLRGAK